MSLPADFDLKERVRSAVDIVDVVGRDLELRPQGRNFVARCPFHNDTRPSMTVSQDRQTWKCWVCDIGGDIFSFLMRREGVDFPTALRILAEQAGIPVEEFSGGKKAAPGSPEDKATLLSAVKVVADAYFDALAGETSDDAKLAREYLAERGIDAESRKRFRIGFAPDSWDFAVNALRKKGFSGEVAEAAGVAIARRTGGGHYDRFRGRLMFPIHDLQDRPISLGGRIIPAIAQRQDHPGGSAKYINGPETKLFRKSHQLYGLQLARDAIRRGGEVLVMEGYTDVVAAWQAGVEPVVAVLGTALGENHVKILNRFAGRVVLVLDGDAAGQRRADEVLELFVRANADLRVLTLPEGNDPADYLAEHSRESFEKLVGDAPDALDHRLSRLTEGIDVTRDTHRVTTAIDEMLGVIARAPRGDSLRTDQLMLRLSRTFGLGTERLRGRLDALRRSRQAAASRGPSRQSAPPRRDPNAALHELAEAGEWAEPSPAAAGAAGQPRVDLQPITGIDRELFETLIECPELAGMAVEAIDADWLQTNSAKMLLSAYQDLDLAGHELTTESLLLMIENEPLKNQVVTLQERVSRRAGQLAVTAEQRYHAIVIRYREQEQNAEKTRQIAQLEARSLPEDEEMALLKELFDAERTRHTIRPGVPSAPTPSEPDSQ